MEQEIPSLKTFSTLEKTHDEKEVENKPFLCFTSFLSYDAVMFESRHLCIDACVSLSVHNKGAFNISADDRIESEIDMIHGQQDKDGEEEDTGNEDDTK
ncbi:uncharacterized protein MONOS_12262 [Monocercomonoides exilis]|uniref:uncharacterized protein n=1 Tax=Monocercomonoides exilis TaxID=2049356 RepID=UPI00355AA1BE|nr:hypothetical protein MONOS_12262 [Monocercomonoides exilis]|eukprot:MONOS_12262.1-p1 / transcript=MONOS_12262.1 / gene=MONOS_12262 / organism=Monocercomonoides_exilis_PA203 / gene_product=unspecified product / transcript_product=unspecified product / location=Mono_scaffold00667:12249-12545(+) / protein_length=99 / sequence_SO=supercontig / SO=protein_coding / is_pseudo=false